jgi:hypothetical protein
LAAVLAMAWGPPAGAAHGTLHLTWNECAGATSATQDLASACAGDAGSQELIVAFTPDATVDSVLAAEIVLDVRFAGPSVPAWWEVGGVGCRAGELTPFSTPSSGGGCTDWWNRELSPGFLYQTGEAWQTANQARIVVAFAVPGDEPARVLSAGTRYFAARLRLDNIRTSSCAGCAEAACLVLNSIRLVRVPGQPGGDPVLDTPAPSQGNWATWQGSGGDCSTVRGRYTTWGRLKSLYR